MGIHPTAIVATSAVIGEEVDVGPYCVVGEHVRLGDRTRLVAHVVIDGDTWVGEDCELFPFCSIGTTPQDKKLKATSQPPRLRIGNGNRSREHVTIHGGTPFGGGPTTGGTKITLVGHGFTGYTGEGCVGDCVVRCAFGQTLTGLPVPPSCDENSRWPVAGGACL